MRKNNKRHDSRLTPVENVGKRLKKSFNRAVNENLPRVQRNLTARLTKIYRAVKQKENTISFSEIVFPIFENDAANLFDGDINLLFLAKEIVRRSHKGLGTILVFQLAFEHYRFVALIKEMAKGFVRVESPAFGVVARDIY